MIPKISLAAAFLLLAAPPMACASTRDAINPAPINSNAHESRTGILIAQDAQPAMGTGEGDNATDNDNDNGAADDPNASADDNGNQNADGGKADQNNAGDDQPVPPTVLNGNDNDSGEVPPINPLPQSEPMSPQQ